MSIVLVGVGAVHPRSPRREPRLARIKMREDRGPAPHRRGPGKHKKSVALSMGARLAENAFFYVYTTFILAYSTEQLESPSRPSSTGVLLAAALDLAAIPLFGHLSDRFGAAPSTCSAPSSRPSSSSRSSFSSARGARSSIALGNRRRRDHRARGDVRTASELLLGALRRAGPLQRRVARLPARLRPRGWPLADDRRRTTSLGARRVVGDGRVHGRLGTRHAHVGLPRARNGKRPLDEAA